MRARRVEQAGIAHDRTPGDLQFEIGAQRRRQPDVRMAVQALAQPVGERGDLLIIGVQFVVQNGFVDHRTRGPACVAALQRLEHFQGARRLHFRIPAVLEDQDDVEVGNQIIQRRRVVGQRTCRIRQGIRPQLGDAHLGDALDQLLAHDRHRFVGDQQHALARLDRHAHVHDIFNPTRIRHR